MTLWFTGKSLSAVHYVPTKVISVRNKDGLGLMINAGMLLPQAGSSALVDM